MKIPYGKIATYKDIAEKKIVKLCTDTKTQIRI
ncbi:Uncharacterised protein [Campylobacter jejuni]|nr:Uncharacterised protein [Campylobacter jejuni]